LSLFRAVSFHAIMIYDEDDYRPRGARAQRMHRGSARPRIPQSRNRVGARARRSDWDVSIQARDRTGRDTRLRCDYDARDAARARDSRRSLRPVIPELVMLALLRPQRRGVHIGKAQRRPRLVQPWSAGTRRSGIFAPRATSINTPSQMSSVGINTNQVMCQRSWRAQAMPLAIRNGPLTMGLLGDPVEV
jgi:hypothetical protein